MGNENGLIAKMAFTPFPLSLSLPWRSIVIRLPIDVGRKRKEVSGWVMDQDDWSLCRPTFALGRTAAFSVTNMWSPEKSTKVVKSGNLTRYDMQALSIGPIVIAVAIVVDIFCQRLQASCQAFRSLFLEVACVQLPI